MAKRVQVLVICLLVLVSSSGCAATGTTVTTGPFVYGDGGAVEIQFGLDVNSNGEVILTKDFSISTIGPVGLGWHVSTEEILNETHPEVDTLVLLWEDASGQVWKKTYDIGQSFAVGVNEKQRIRDHKIEGGSIILFLEPVGPVPGYEDLQDDIRTLVQRWDIAHDTADRYWDTSDLPNVLQGEALEQQLDTVAKLQSWNCYWEIRELTPSEIIYLETLDAQSLLVDVRKNWDMDRICNGSKDGDQDGYFTARYRIEQIDGAWFITHKEVAANE